MFYMWAKFCEKNKNNEFLPKFYGIETFVFNNDNYIQFRQEKLVKTSAELEDITQEMINSAEISSFDQFEEAWIESEDRIGEMLRGNDRVWMKKFYKTAQALKKIADKKGWVYDIHEDNIMMRPDGTPVVIDPWFAGWGKS